MSILLGLAFEYVLIDALMALIALVVGFCSALWYVRYADSAPADSEDADVELKEQEEANNSERANMAALQLRDLAKNVASDVGAHSTLVAEINESLDGLSKEDANADVIIMEAVNKIVSANEKLQGRLADAEKKIQIQAEEIRDQQTEARTDALTNLANRRAFDDALEKNLKIFQQTERPFSLLIFDVDHFKNFNDTHGHQAGDEVLRKVGAALKRVVKSKDLPCRYGGEEFALVMPNTSAEEGCVAAERVRKAIEEMAVPFEGKDLRVTASIGLAQVDKNEDAVRIIRRADDAVYAAKDAGRNNSHWNDGEECLPVETFKKHAAEKRASEKGAQEASAEKESKGLASSTLEQLPDRHIFVEELGRRISESHRFAVDLSVMHLSVKDYKNLEQLYGQAVGALILDSVAQFVRSTLREMDLLCKLDMGEFAVMLPGSSQTESKLVGSRMQMAISNCTLPLGDKQLRLEIEWDVTDVEPDDDAESILARAMEPIVSKKKQEVAVSGI